VKPSNKKREAEARAVMIATFQAHSVILHLLFNVLADSGPAAGRTAFKEGFRKFAAARMRDFIAVADIEELPTFEEAAFGEIASILSDREQTHWPIQQSRRARPIIEKPPLLLASATA
jgi:hypothetical protein